MVEVNGSEGVTNSEVVIGDIYREFMAAVEIFSAAEKVRWPQFLIAIFILYSHHFLQDLLSLGPDSQFEGHFFVFRCKVQQLERRLGLEIGAWLQRSPSLQAQLRIMELFQYTSHRDTVRVCSTYTANKMLSCPSQDILVSHHEAVVTAVLSDIEDVVHTLTSSHPTLLPHTPPTASKLLWLHSLGERASRAVAVVKSVAPELLEGELGWKLRHIYSDLTEKLQRLVGI